jgi:ADP-ribosyl-[dinitrogen reductase] hydrolase
MNKYDLQSICSTNNYENHIKGALVGGWCGDASGAPLLEFYKHIINGYESISYKEIVNESLKMKGGGIFGVGKGQVTNHSELELAMIYGMLRAPNKNNFPYKEICEEYIEWMQSKPFDISRACANAFSTSTNVESMLKNAKDFNYENQTNSLLTRATPLAIWGLNLSDEDLMKIVCLDSRLSHSNELCQLVNCIYVLVLRHLILHPNNKEGALNIIIRYSYDCKPLRIWYSETCDYKNINPRENSNYLKHVFQLMVYFLNSVDISTNKDGSVKREKFDNSYEEVIRRVLLLGGDTNTNAKIIGSLIGAIKGYDGIPDYMKECVLNFDCKESGRIRPEKYLIKNIFQKIDLLYY